MTEDNTRAMFDDLRHEIETLSASIYGDKRALPNGGGLYGEIRRLREQATENAVRQDARMDELDRKIIEMSKQLWPMWWNYVIVGGGVALIVMLIIEIMQIAGVL